ncbi:MAG: hypothetical protein ACR2I0_01995, partial [Rhodoferax sp.]
RVPEDVVQRVRHAMLDAVEEHLSSSDRRLEDRISYAWDIDSLWYLRPDLMNAIAAISGETVARDCINAITTQFQGYHPGGKPTRLIRQ